MLTEDQVIQALRGVTDPELGLNIVDLGLIEGISIRGERVEVGLVMTSPACPQGEFLADETARALETADPTVSAQVSVLRDPPWSPDRISPEGRQALGWSR